ncbi:MAG: hypothetical protein V2J25_10155 [Desulfatiglans sp.]|jgi:LemA protein|nr:hypothetical protein [Thermodesulfobacteriota bacterium]MEE4353221.1 hypothetical protein [Desulfatiglans sp.]
MWARITEIRSQVMAGGLSDDEKVVIDNHMSGALRGLMVAVENYPQLSKPMIIFFSSRRH